MKKQITLLTLFLVLIPAVNTYAEYPQIELEKNIENVIMAKVGVTEMDRVKLEEFRDEVKEKGTQEQLAYLDKSLEKKLFVEMEFNLCNGPCPRFR